MKQFLKMMLAVICGILVTFFVIFFLVSSMLTSLASSADSQPALPKSGVLLIDMSEISIVEQASQPGVMDIIESGGQMSESIGLWKAVQALNAAKDDPSVKYIYLKADGASGGIAQLQEFRKSLAAFRSSGKPIVSYIESPSTASYYLASVADKVYMTSYQGASTMVIGIGSQLIFLKDLLDKVGVNVQLIRHGKYKSAGEMYIKNAPSPENLEQNQVMIDALWSSYASEIAESRDLTVDEVNAAIDSLKLNLPEDFLNTKFVDELLTREELHSKLAILAGKEDFKNVKTIDFGTYVKAKVLDNSKAKNKIAIIYADGDIVDGSAKTDVAGDYMASQIAKVRADSSVKAVVFRVNSPGGSVLASEKIKTEIQLLQDCKPVVASYGNYAASGGYWISNGCDKIFSDATTLTGSIGVFSMIPEFSNVLKNVAHVNIVTVGSNKHADMYSLMRPFDQQELDYMQTSVETIYDRFVQTVSQGRHLQPDYVDSIAQGRVWAGSDALKIGLVDEIGTLEDAIHYTASIAGDPDLAAWNIAEYPKPMTSMEQMMEMLGQSTPEENVFSGTPFSHVADVFIDWNKRVKKNTADVVFARIPYAIDIK